MHPLESQLVAAWPPQHWSDVTVLVATSGGADSVALLRALAAIGQRGPGKLVVAHYNHRLRGSESDADEAFVGELARGLHLLLVTGRASNPAGVSAERSEMRLFEEQCRTQRYQFLRGTAEEYGARYVAMAHTADDQAETILHRILRGTGLRGLAGIPRIRPLGPATTIVRPLLGITRAQIIQYLAALGQDYRSDSTNELLHGTRNRIRRELIPHIETRYNPRFKAALLNLGRLAGEAQSLIDELVDEVLARALINRTETACQIDCGQLRAAPRYVVRECFIRIWQQQGWPRQSLDFEHLQLLADLVLAPGAGAFARQTLPGAVLARRGGDQLYLVRANPDA